MSRVSGVKSPSILAHIIAKFHLFIGVQKCGKSGKNTEPQKIIDHMEKFDFSKFDYLNFNANFNYIKKMS